MIVVYMTASVLGGAATAAWMGQQDLLLGLVTAPLGGSLAALAATPLAFYGRDDSGIPAEVVWC